MSIYQRIVNCSGIAISIVVTLVFVGITTLALTGYLNTTRTEVESATEHNRGVSESVVSGDDPQYDHMMDALRTVYGQDKDFVVGGCSPVQCEVSPSDRNQGMNITHIVFRNGNADTVSTTKQIAYTTKK